MPAVAITSEKSPIEVFWVAAEAHGTPGRLGLTFAPGKKGPSTYMGGSLEP